MVRRYPATRVTAVDTDGHSLEVAEREMKELGMLARARAPHIGCQLLPTSRYLTIHDDAGFRDVGVIAVNPTHVVVHGTK